MRIKIIDKSTGKEVTEIDGHKLWGVSLCGNFLIVDNPDRFYDKKINRRKYEIRIEEG
jgi:hypothetical protein